MLLLYLKSTLKKYLLTDRGQYMLKLRKKIYHSLKTTKSPKTKPRKSSADLSGTLPMMSESWFPGYALQIEGGGTRNLVHPNSLSMLSYERKMKSLLTVRLTLFGWQHSSLTGYH